MCRAQSRCKGETKRDLSGLPRKENAYATQRERCDEGEGTGRRAGPRGSPFFFNSRVDGGRGVNGVESVCCRLLVCRFALVRTAGSRGTPGPIEGVPG